MLLFGEKINFLFVKREIIKLMFREFAIGVVPMLRGWRGDEKIVEHGIMFCVYHYIFVQ